ncbi:MAG: OmpA family protein [Flavobacteriaceae bacterium]|nr:OmpA family protein [Flavobacteriaceae bacterium]
MKRYFSIIVSILSIVALSAQEGSGKYSIKNIDVNTKNSDFGTSFMSPNKLVFTAPRTGFTVIRDVWEPNGQRFLDLYTGDIDENGEVSNKQRLQGEVNSRYHEGDAVFTKDGKVVYFTRNNYYRKQLGVDNTGWTNLALFKATVNNEGEWINIIPMPFNNVEYSVGHPALSDDEKTLYFASDMPGSMGEMDIYKVDVNESGFGNPVNLGPKVNSTAKDWFPFVDGEVLYFASDRAGGKGGSDVYASKLTGFTPKPVLLNAPINSINDDYAFIIDKDSRKGYFSSNREGGKGDDDIYSLIEEEPVEFKCQQVVLGEVLDKATGDALQGAEINLRDKDENILQTVTSDEKGEFTMEISCETEYQIEGKKEGYAPQIKNFTTSDVADLEISPRILLGKGDIDLIAARNTQDEEEDVKPEGLPDVLPDEIVRLRASTYAVNIEPIYFDLNSSFLNKKAQQELQKVVDLMNKYPDMIIESASHTDVRGPDGYNMWLSDRRAKSTVNFIIDRGIDPRRITGKGYGETQIINQCSEGVQCTEAEHERNRRTEFVIIKM